MGKLSNNARQVAVAVPNVSVARIEIVKRSTT
jgi:hypothetical protein